MSLTGRAGGEFGNKGLATGTGLPLGDRLAAAFVLTDGGLTGALVSLDAGGSFHFADASITLLYPLPPAESIEDGAKGPNQKFGTA